MIEEYLTQRFIRNNRKAYWKYCNEWISNVTGDQIESFIKEKQRLNL